MHFQTTKPGPEIIYFFMLNSAEHEILIAHKFKKQEIQHFQCSDKPRLLFFPFSCSEMIKRQQHLSAGKILCSVDLSMIFYNVGASIV